MDPSSINFTHGVASGDPYPNFSINLWTKASPTMDDDRSKITVSGTVTLYNHDTEEYACVSKSPVCVSHQVATDKNLSHIVTRGQAYTSSDIDYTVKVEATGLKPFTQYYSQFSVCGSSTKSPVGRMKTSPRSRYALSSVAVAVYSCSNSPNGFFNAYGNFARKGSVDYIIHLGDYIYEYATISPARVVQPKKEIFTLYDYRRRIATYRTGLDLLLSYQRFAWIPV